MSPEQEHLKNQIIHIKKTIDQLEMKYHILQANCSHQFQSMQFDQNEFYKKCEICNLVDCTSIYDESPKIELSTANLPTSATITEITGSTNVTSSLT